MTDNNKIVLITGASSGIGRALSLLLSERGYHVYGTSRKCENPSVDSEGDQNNPWGFLKMLKLDINDQQSIDAAVKVILEAEGRIDILVNNAGYGIAGPIEETDMDEARNQFETNYFGVVRMIQAVLPTMREQRSGHIINIGSVAGIISLPFQSFYSCTKYAIEALTDSLSLEVKRYGIQVTCVEPGDTNTGFANARINRVDPTSVYSESFKCAMGRMEEDERNGHHPSKVAYVIGSVIRRNNPPLRISVGCGNKFLIICKRIMPSRLFMRLLANRYLR